jgi:hypothetical protein
MLDSPQFAVLQTTHSGCRQYAVGTDNVFRQSAGSRLCAQDSAPKAWRAMAAGSNPEKTG